VLSLPGLIDILPDPEIFPDAQVLYQRAAWPSANAPRQIWLDQSRQVKRLLARSPILATVRAIVTHGRPTLGQLAAGGALQVGRRNRPGDGTVLTRSAAPNVPGMAFYRAQTIHSLLPRDQAVIDAVDSLLKNGSCALPVLTRAEIDDFTEVEESVTLETEETVADDLMLRMRGGIFTQRDADFMLRWDNASLPGPAAPAGLPA